MPIVGLPAPPTFPPPDGTQWTPIRNIVLHSLISEAGVGTGVNAETSYEVGANGPIPAVDGAADYALSRLYYVKCQQYLDGAPLGYLTVSYLTEALVNEPAEGTYWKIDGGDFIWFKDPSVGSTPTWPFKFRVTVTTTVAPPGGSTIGISIDEVRADIWAALPVSSRLPRINPSNPGLDPEQAGLELTWSRRNARVPRVPHQFGEVAALTWRPMWDGAKRFLLDGVHLQVDALQETGGYTVQGDWYLIRIPGDTDTTVAPPPSESGVVHPARFDADVFDDPLAVFV
jgi:hypothetical protein